MKVNSMLTTPTKLLRVTMEIEDVTTGCTYICKGETEKKRNV
jgi:hypothetical protein